MPVTRQQLARYGAPALFLAGVTIAVLLVRAGIGAAPASPGTGTLGPVTHASSAPVPKPAQTVSASNPSTAATSPATTSASGGTVAGASYYTVQKGDTFGSIATKEGTTVTQIESLNPGVSSNALQVGEKIRVR